MKYTFNEVLKIVNGRNQKGVEDPNGRYPIYGSGGIMGRANDYLCEADTVIIGRKGSINNPLFVDEPFWNVDTAFGLQADQEILLPRYLFYFCRNYNFERLNKTVTIPSLTKADLLKIQFDIPAISEQRLVVDKLQTIETIISYRKCELSKLDELIKARFVEMFGTGSYPKVPLKDICTVITKGTTPTTAGFQFQEEGINFFKIESITEQHTIDLEKVAHVSEECHANFKRSQLKAGDILFSIAGAIGRTAIIEERNLPGNTNQALAIIRLADDYDMSRRYLICALESPIVTEQYNKKKRGIAQINLSLQDIGNLVVPIPDREGQEIFETFAKQVDKSKAVIQKSLDETQLLFDSLMQKYFG